MIPKTTKKTRPELERKILELESQLAITAATATFGIDGASKEKLMASGVVLRLTALGGREIISPVCIRDGLSNASIEALREDLRQTWAGATAYKPKPEQAKKVVENE